MNSKLDGFSFLFKEIENLKKQVADLKAEMNVQAHEKPQIVAFKAEWVKNLPGTYDRICSGLPKCKGETMILFRST